jgi:hypothetical protein
MKESITICGVVDWPVCPATVSPVRPVEGEQWAVERVLIENLLGQHREAVDFSSRVGPAARQPNTHAIRTLVCALVSVLAASWSIGKLSSSVFMTQEHHGSEPGINVCAGQRLHAVNAIQPLKPVKSKSTIATKP